ncbi:riboflavin synthase, alpha subunit [Batrachochytrium dendrobatidis JEL423]|nr:riboflavin synthase, alpha subunit [Batrachochytrium dendrobatidis JEL423]
MDTSETGGSGYSITVSDASVVLTDVHIGDSIAINGVCMTVTEFDSERTSFKVGVAPETLRKTNLGEFEVGHKVNLERSMSATTRYGGHVVQGHVDTTVTITRITPDPPNSITYRFHVPACTPSAGESSHLPSTDFLQYIVPKGYVCLDGTSLTVIDVDWSTREFSVMLIAHTLKSVVMPTKSIGDRVNIEVDQVGKYVENMVRGMLMSENNTVLAPMIERAVEKYLSKSHQ